MNSKIIIIIGLPGSGKSFLSNEFKNNGYIIFDDFISKFHDCTLLENIKSGSKICINDPRLCYFPTFLEFIGLFELTVDRNDIHLILFINDPKICINNKPTLEKTIVKYSQYYDLNNYVHWKRTIRKVFNEN